MNNSNVHEYSRKLAKIGIEHEIIEHPEFHSSKEAHRFFGSTVADGIPTLIMKADEDFVVIIKREDCKLDMNKIRKELGAMNLRLVNKEEFVKVTGVPIGAARVYNPGIKTLLDKKIFEKEYLLGGSGSFTYAVRYKTADLKKIPQSKIVDISYISKPRILTGDTPTGKLHIGHYVGTLKNRVELQNSYETYIMLANVHAYANNYTKSEVINNNVYNVFLDNLAVGIDPKVSTIFLQSGVPEILELYSFFLTMVHHARVIRNPSVKEEIKYKKLDPSIGFIVYPILQAADILSFNADLVPVGEDQLPVIEQAREIARDFNKTFGDTFVVPQAKVGQVARLVGIDGKLKMSKSGNNAILLSDDTEVLRKKVTMIYTDPNRIHATDKGKVEGNPVFIYHDAFNPDKEEVADLKERYKIGKVSDKEVKEKLFIALDNFLKPIREKRKYYEERPKLAKEILIEGTKRARKVAVKTLERVRDKTKINELIGKG